MDKTPFDGFLPDEEGITLTVSFFVKLLPEIDHPGELRLTLYFFWYLGQLEGPVRFASKSGLLADEQLMRFFGRTPSKATAGLEDALERAVIRKTLLSAMTDTDTYYFLNTPRGRASLDQFIAGKGRHTTTQIPVTLGQQRPNIFILYEANIGPLTPMIAETLNEAEEMYSEAWIEEAMRIAVEKNIRHWRYIEAILRTWKEKGKHGGKNQPDFEERQQQYFRELAERFRQ